MFGMNFNLGPACNTACAETVSATSPTASKSTDCIANDASDARLLARAVAPELVISDAADGIRRRGAPRLRLGSESSESNDSSSAVSDGVAFAPPPRLRRFFIDL